MHPMQILAYTICKIIGERSTYAEVITFFFFFASYFFHSNEMNRKDEMKRKKKIEIAERIIPFV